ncbi:hypothetical protein CH286_08765 [Rhodococcus sp. WWJCD1]|uniref:hypothetical protein n=1 Tax=Rhodococcus sp. WWJCD1 TaxID=2022519 RepID=UPI000B9B2E96|nr:hypothetical protein [Rhodococcus sp. WWJCD1]OZC49593.1 hypothetical protein CH286_08765 [Rhodococcus sp. WWJCD1]
MRKLFTLIGFSVGLVGAVGYLLWEPQPQRVNYAFVGDEQYQGAPDWMLLVFGLPVLGGLLGLAIAVSVGCIRRS